MGTTKVFKTGATAGSYPKPLLYLGFDDGGLDVIQSRSIPATPGDIVLDVTSEGIVYIKPGDLSTWLAKPKTEQPKILAINFFGQRKNPLEQDLRIAVPDQQPFMDFVGVTDLLFNKRTALPWATIELDSVTGFMNCILAFIASKNPAALLDARQWASQVGMKVKNTCACLTCMDAHIVVLIHSEFNKNELTGTITELPAVYSGLRNDIGCYFSQFFYALKQGTKPMVSTVDYQFVRGLGMRWPTGLPAICGPTFKDLYGKEILTA